jgi:hypothetical protein
MGANQFPFLTKKGPAMNDRELTMAGLLADPMIQG